MHTVLAEVPSAHKSISFTPAGSNRFSQAAEASSINRQMFGATQFNFTAQLGAGVQPFTSKHRSIDFGYKYHRISNANLGRINPGMDSHVVFVGVSFVR
jgi:opacity protein-like surface antigen